MDKLLEYKKQLTRNWNVRKKIERIYMVNMVS